ncbi:MAG: PEP-utilizing enzyme [Patescibacteria group bacterium]
MNDSKWVSNYIIPRVGYHLPFVWSSWGLSYVQKIFFGKQIIKEHFNHMVGVDLLGAYFRKNELRELIETAIKKVFDDPDFIENNHREAYRFNDDYFKYAQKVLNFDLTKKSDKELAEIVTLMIDGLAHAQAHAVITTWFVDSDGQDLTNKLLAIIDEYVKKGNQDVKVSEVFSLLTTPSKTSLLIREEIESLEILQIILKNSSAEEAIKNLANSDAIPANIDVHLSQKINEHLKKWCWTPFAYLGPSYKIGDYLKLWHDQILNNINPEAEIAERIEKPKLIESKRAALKASLDLTENQARIFDITADIIFLKNYRKDVSFHGYYVLNKVFQEIGKRKFLSINQLQVMSHIEIIEMLNSGKSANLMTINKRKSDTIILIRDGKSQILSGIDASSFIRKEESYIEKDTIDVSAKEFKGVCACSGHAKGPIKIINTPEEMGKMDEGDIMLSHTTFPSLVPAMKKAAAIITEDGGVTCHAAIVARELNTPCVTGIKLLTSILKDGDMVEVDANSGIVKILNK